jgi:tetratricopeptide (TPR) repeat protein
VNLNRLHIQLGEQKLRERWYEGAFQEAQFVLRLVPNHPQGLVLLVQTCELWKSPKCNIDEAFSRALAINPNAAGTYTAQGIYLHRARRFPQAIESFKRALELDPNSVNAQYNIGLAYIETKQYDLANQHAQQAYALGAPFPGLRNRLQKAGYWKPEPAPEAPAAQAQPPHPPERRDEAATAEPPK